MKFRIAVLACLALGCSNAKTPVAPVPNDSPQPSVPMVAPVAHPVSAVPKLSPSPEVEKSAAPAAPLVPELDLAVIQERAAPSRDLTPEQEDEQRERDLANFGRLSDADSEWLKRLSADVKAGKKLAWPDARRILQYLGRSNPRLEVYVVERAAALIAAPLLVKLGDDPLDIGTLYRFVMLSGDDEKRLREIAQQPALALDDARFLHQVQLGSTMARLFLHERFASRGGERALIDLGENADNPILKERFALLDDGEQDHLAAIGADVKAGVSVDWTKARALLKADLGTALTEDAVASRVAEIGDVSRLLRELNGSEPTDADLARYLLLTREEQAEILRIGEKIAGYRLRVRPKGATE